ncbi:tRNA threonylcarbamoyladenosine biosynthesis protein RimN [Mergibacter septicus]|uniref:Threonylcarbamoyl-AMP synthase n=1 Tax=Mergibacter septicus TaxID=221402 RepID=A0A8D4J1E9_9PAST|nr:Sua5/YciO/YrdC/YwlC family protein [Mergibacter septicus]AWX16324.1 tRNA threonylcarbamoyladenosine biosynthesis protein RimN [Mergibacter septicus]QDJ15575.1 tRNA threonylcarbamoyladenosine biosynthesis protein RimN [Mergibacter septicus]UTU48802.1 Sua5/YciO/YrdC/YwlC family protein [Mergibacter septicus]WMR95567.1 Sua5/YciO/YrdC/YwlC family protein [Mergibacter septicus]
MNNIIEIVRALQQDQVVAYPTEAVFGLGCNPNSEIAIKNLLSLKQRPIEKGLILIAPELSYFTDFVDFSRLLPHHLKQIEQVYAQPTTWVVPVKENVSTLLCGQFNSIAIRLCSHPLVRQLCQQTGFALTSTSANLTGLEPCRTVVEVQQQFGETFPILKGKVGLATKPSEIRDIFTNQVIRQG